MMTLFGSDFCYLLRFIKTKLVLVVPNSTPHEESNKYNMANFLLAVFFPSFHHLPHVNENIQNVEKIVASFKKKLTKTNIL